MSTRRRTWLTRVGLAGLLLFLALGALVGRHLLQRREHQRLREAEVGRAPVVGPRRANLSGATPLKASCLGGVVLDHGVPVGGMQVSASDSPFSVSGDCPCPRPASFCRCGEGVALLPTLPRAGLVEAVRSTTSDLNGRFELCGLEGDGTLMLVWAEHADGRFAVRGPLEEGHFSKPGSWVELQVITLLPVQGVVLRKQTPVPGATVSAFARPPLLVRTFTTDARGRFEAKLPLGISDFVVGAQSLSAQHVKKPFQPQWPLVLELESLGELTVRAVFEERPVPGAEVAIEFRVAYHEVFGAPKGPLLTDAKGEARVSLLVGHPLEIAVTKDELIGSSVVELLEGTPRRIDVVLDRGLRVAGLVTDELGKPHSARVEGLGKGSSLRTDEAGRFVSRPVKPGPFYPVASAPGCADSERRSIEVGEEQLTLTLKLSCIESANGVVLDAEGMPIEGAIVRLDSVGHDEASETDEAGRFKFHTPPGAYQLTVSHKRYRSFEQPLQLPAKDITVVLDAGGSISGRVLDGAGAGVPKAGVTVVPAVFDELLGELPAMLEGSNRVDTDAEGNFEVTGLLAGRLVVSATADSQGTVVSDALVLNPGEHRQGLILRLAERVDAGRRISGGGSGTWSLVGVPRVDDPS